MGVYAEFYCRQCGFRVRFGGPEEFYYDAYGRRRNWGHPLPASDEARQAGISGFLTRMWCPHCRSVKHAVIAEFKQPLQYTEAWERLAEMDEPREPAVCPDCGRPLGCCIRSGCPSCGSKLKTTIVTT